MSEWITLDTHHGPVRAWQALLLAANNLFWTIYVAVAARLALDARRT